MDTYTPPARVIVVSKLNLFQAMISAYLAGYVIRIVHGIGSKGFCREQGTGGKKKKKGGHFDMSLNNYGSILPRPPRRGSRKAYRSVRNQIWRFQE